MENTMDWIALLGIAVTVLSTVCGWLYAGLKNEIKELKETKNALAEKLQHHEVTVAKDYALRDDLEKLAKSYKEDLDKLMNAMFTKLDRIESKLDNKVDK
jgi:hypothetical protein